MAENGDTLSLEYNTCFKKIFSLFYISKQQNIHLWSFFVLYFLNILVENGDWFKSKQYFTKKSSQLRNIFVNFKQRNLKKHLKVRETLFEKFKENWKTLLANLDIKNRFDNRRFWKTVESLFSDKLMHKEIINLIKKKRIRKTRQQMIKMLPMLLASILVILYLYLFQVKNYQFQITPSSASIYFQKVTKGSVETTVNNFKDHPSVKLITNIFNRQKNLFSF